MDDPRSPTYASYLRLPDLLRLQPGGESHDELLFVVIHQAHELWFTVVLRELDRARERLAAHDLRATTAALERMTAVWKSLVASWDVLDTLTPMGYLGFRDRLGTGSGFQSVQFREIEISSGGGVGDHLHDPWLGGEERDRLARRSREPSLRELFLRTLTAAGRTVDDVVRHAVADVGLADLAEALVAYDGAVAQWRYRHALAVERQIGTKIGTGGSSGSAYLQATTSDRFFPELIAARSRL
ncbi:MAG: Tryptophan 2,3-dioxygenase [Acidimicrobiales bacterium]|nr:Tryptophan 2,3-dioxygenase [Acidimicrobiales bacterium]